MNASAIDSMSFFAFRKAGGEDDLFLGRRRFEMAQEFRQNSGYVRARELRCVCNLAHQTDIAPTEHEVVSCFAEERSEPFRRPPRKRESAPCDEAQKTQISGGAYPCGNQGCGSAGFFLNRFKQQDHAPREARVPRWLITIGIIALMAMLAGFLVFGGANMGH
ncbi:MAG: hypothetical protein WDM89_17515 [Rhizomicrobium sp.]